MMIVIMKCYILGIYSSSLLLLLHYILTFAMCQRSFGMLKLLASLFCFSTLCIFNEQY